MGMDAVKKAISPDIPVAECGFYAGSVEVSLRLMARTLPQIPIMKFGFPIKVMVGFFFLGRLMCIMPDRIASLVQGLDGLFINLLRSAVGRMYQ